METKQHIQILQIKEIPFEVNREVNITSEMMKDVKFSFLIVLQHIKGKDVVGLHTVVRYYLPDGKELLQGGATVIAKIPGWVEIEDDDEKIKSSSMIMEFVSYANAFVSGLFYKEAEGTPLNSAFIPKIPAEDLVKGMKIELVDCANS